MNVGVRGKTGLEMDHVCGGACGGGWAQGGRKNCLVVKLDSNLTLCFYFIFCTSL